MGWLFIILIQQATKSQEKQEEPKIVPILGPGIPKPIVKTHCSSNQGQISTTTRDSLHKTMRKEGHVLRNLDTL